MEKIIDWVNKNILSRSKFEFKIVVKEELSFILKGFKSLLKFIFWGFSLIGSHIILGFLVIVHYGSMFFINLVRGIYRKYKGDRVDIEVNRKK